MNAQNRDLSWAEAAWQEKDGATNPADQLLAADPGHTDELVWVEEHKFLDHPKMYVQKYYELAVKYWLVLGGRFDGKGNAIINATYKRISEKSGLTPKQVLRVIARLKNKGALAVKRRSAYLEITLFDYRGVQQEVGIVTQAISDDPNVPTRFGVNAEIAYLCSPEVVKRLNQNLALAHAG